MKKFVDDSEKEYEDIQPIMDFSKTEEASDNYAQKGKQVKAFLKNQMQTRLLEFFIGILFIFLTTKTGVLGSILFMVAIFYLIPDGLIKSIVYIYRYRHYEDYIESNDYRVTGGYISIVMTAIRKKGVFNAGRSENND